VRRFRVLMKKYWILDNGHACNMDQKIEQLQTLMTTPKPEKADAIVWLQGNMYDRGEKVLELYHAGYAPWIVVTGNNTRAVEDDNVKIHDIVSWLEKHGVDRSAVLVDDQSINTLDQATHVVASAKAQGWRAILLVGSTHHQLRAFLTFLHQLRAQAWNGRIINQPAHIEWDARPGGRRRTTGEAFQDEIKKLEKYKDSVATVEEGLRYFNL